MFTRKPTSSDPSSEPQPAEANAPDGAAPAENTATPEKSAREAELETELATLKDQALRSLADAENTRRRLEREMDDVRKYAITGFARDLLAVADNLRRAIAAVPAEQREQDEAVKNLLVGVEATERQLLAAFEKYNVKAVPSLGNVFDPNKHQVMFEIESAEHAVGTILQELQSGYEIEGRLLRPALVGTAKAPVASTPVDTKA